MSRAPLAGCRIIDLGIITAGASTSAMLADLGADVIKVEASAYIDPFRMWDKGLGAEDWWNKSRFFDFTNRNKRGLALDLKTPKGKELFLDLVANADIIVENFRRGVLERLGLGYDTLSARNPRVVLVSVTSQGQTGPDAKAASFGSTLEATSGLADLTRDAQGVPLISGILLNYPDQIVSLYAAGVATLAVMEQRRTGQGAWLDISQRELASFLIGEHILAASAGAVPAPANAAALAATKLVLAGDGRWLLCHGASRESLYRAAETLAPGGRSTLDAVALTTAFAKHDVQAMAVRNGDDMLEAVRRGETRMAFAQTPDGTDVKGLPLAFAGAPLAITRRAPGLGEHNAEILRDLLGLDATAIAALEANGIIGSKPKG
jgi:crotonobetainyl-CoA:carnitine CoA-transferase CaiB-like acyl-CoA transferase